VKEVAGICFNCSMACFVCAGPIHRVESSEELFVKQETKETSIESAVSIHHLGLNVHQDLGRLESAEGPVIGSEPVEPSRDGKGAQIRM
jgi:hypothetical protein